MLADLSTGAMANIPPLRGSIKNYLFDSAAFLVLNWWRSSLINGISSCISRLPSASA